jgi:hypothetical protein
MKLKRRAVAWRRVYLDTAAVRSSDTTNRWQPEASPRLSRGEERIEDPSEIFFTDTVAIVRHFHYSFRFKFFGLIVFRSGHPNPNLTIAICRFDGIDDQVQDGVFNLRRVDGNDYGIRGRFEFYVDAIAIRDRTRQLRTRQINGALHDVSK